MKKREGFVSNSSSSSFVLLTSVKNHERVYKKLTDYEKEVVDEVVEYKKVFNKEMVVGSTYDNQGYSTFEDVCISAEPEASEGPHEYYEEGEEYSCWEAWSFYLGQINEKPNEVFSQEVDM